MGGIVKAVKSVVKGAVNVVKDVVKGVGKVVKAALDDPITTIAKVAAYATGNAWAIPLIDGASTIAKGGDLGDAIKVAAISYGTGKIASTVGTPVGKAAGSYAAQQGASDATQKLVTNIMTRAAGNAAVAIVTNQDPVKAFVAGGATAAAPAILGKVPGFRESPQWVQNSVSSAVGASIAGRDVNEAVAGSLIRSADIVGKALKAFDPDGTKLTEGQRTIAADAIFRTTQAAVTGKDLSAELQLTLKNAAVKALGEYAKDGIKTATNAMAEYYAKVTGTGDQLNAVVSKSEAAANQYNSVRDSLNAAVNEQDRLKAAMDAAVKQHNDASDNTYLEAANKAVDDYNNYVTALNKSYNEYYKPELDRLSQELTTYDKQYEDLTGVLKKDQGVLQKEIDRLTKELDPVYASSNRAFAESLMPGFDAEAYRALNPNIPKDADPFLHYISEGMFQGLRGTKDQLKESTDIMNEILGNPNVDERALQAYIDSGFFSKDFAAKTANKAYADLVAELDKRVTTEDEAKSFFKDVFGREAESPEDMAVVNQYLNMAEDAARGRYYASKVISDDAQSFVYDGSNAKSQDEAAAEAKARGYNTYAYEGKTHTIMPQAELAKRTELINQLLAEEGKNIATASDTDIERAVELINNVPQQVVDTASIQDIIKGNYSGWRNGKYYSYAGDKLQAVYVISPETGSLTLERLEVAGIGNPTEKVVLKTSTLQDLASEDPDAYLFMASQFDDQAKGDMGDFFTNSLNAAVLAAHITGNKTLANNLQQTLAIGSQGVGEQVENLAKFYASVTGGDYNSSVIRAAESLKEWGAANQSQSTKDQEAAIVNAVAGAEGVTGKIGAFVNTSLANPGGFFTMVSKELVQEVLPLWAARGVMTAGKLAAYGTNAAIQGLESWGSNAGEVYDAAIRNGKSDIEARDMASKAGFQGFVVSAVANGIGDAPVVRKIIGDGVYTSFGDLSKATAREAVTEYFDELLTNANNQRITTGTVNWDYATVAATISSGVGAGTTAGILAGLNINQSAVVARDLNGNNVTLNEFLSGTRQVDMNTVNMNATVGKAEDGDDITLGGVAAMPLASGVSYDLFTTGVPSVLTNQNFVLGKDALGNNVTLATAMGQVTDKVGFDTVYNNLLNTTADERTQAQTEVISNAFKNAGFTTYTKEDVKALLNTENPDGVDTFLRNAEQYADPRVTDIDEARQIMLDLGYVNPTDEEVAEFAGSIAETQSATNIGAYVEPRIVTEAMARDFFQSYGYIPNEEELAQFVRQGRDVLKTRVAEEVGQFIDPRQVTTDEARTFFQSLGYTPTDEEVAQFVKQGPDVQQNVVQQLLGEYVDPRFVTSAEVRDFYTKLGFADVTDEDAAKLSGQYDQTLLDARAREYLPIATYNAMAQTAQRAAEAENAARQAQAQQALRTQRMGNVNTMMGMLAQSPDIGGQQVTVKAPDPARIGYIYDWNSIFANPAQEQMFVTPFSQPQQPTISPMMAGRQQRPMGATFAQGGEVRNEVDDVNNELLKILRG